MFRRPIRSEVEAQKNRPEHVEQTQQADEAGGRHDCDPSGEDLLAHGRGLPQHADAGGHVHAQHAPQQPELRRLQRVIDVDIVRADQPAGRGRRGGLEVRSRHAHQRRAEHHEHEVAGAQYQEGLSDAHMRGR